MAVFIIRLSVLFVAIHATLTGSTIIQKRDSESIDGNNESQKDVIPVEADANYVDDIEHTYESGSGGIEIDPKYDIEHTASGSGGSDINDDNDSSGSDTYDAAEFLEED